MPAFCHVFYIVFQKGTTDPKQTIKQPKANLQPQKWENWHRVRSRSFTFVLLCQPFKKTTTNQKTRNQTNNKKQVAHPKGESQRVGSCHCVFCVFVFFWFCLSIAEMPSRNCRWLHISDIVIANVPSRNCQCMCKGTVKKLHCEGVLFCKFKTNAFISLLGDFNNYNHMS